MNESRLAEFWQNSLRHRSFVIRLILSMIMFLTGVVALFSTPYSVELLDIPHKHTYHHTKNCLYTIQRL